MWFNCIYFNLLTTFMLCQSLTVFHFITDTYSLKYAHANRQTLCLTAETSSLPAFPHFFVVFSSSDSHVAPAGMQRECLVCRQRFWAFLILHRKQDRTWERHSGLFLRSAPGMSMIHLTLLIPNPQLSLVIPGTWVLPRARIWGECRYYAQLLPRVSVQHLWGQTWIAVDLWMRSFRVLGVGWDL